MGTILNSHFTDENLEAQSVAVSCPGQVVNSAIWWNDLAKTRFLLLFREKRVPNLSSAGVGQRQGWRRAKVGAGAGVGRGRGRRTADVGAGQASDWEKPH